MACGSPAYRKGEAMEVSDCQARNIAEDELPPLQKAGWDGVGVSRKR